MSRSTLLDARVQVTDLNRAPVDIPAGKDAQSSAIESQTPLGPLLAISRSVPARDADNSPGEEPRRV